MCEPIKRRTIRCSSEDLLQGYDSKVDICLDDCPKDTYCSENCFCEPEDLGETFDCNDESGNKYYDPKVDACRENCKEGSYCNEKCQCEVQEIANCSGTRARSFDPKVDICRDDCSEGEYCTETCNCKEKAIIKKQVGCLDNTEEVDQTDRNFFSSDKMTCVDNCRAGYKCHESSCTCTRVRPLTGITEDTHVTTGQDLVGTELVEMELVGTEPIHVPEPQPIDCSLECGKQNMIFGQPDYTSEVMGQLEQHGCVSGASISVAKGTISNPTTGESCDCFAKPANIEITVDPTPPTCMGTPCGDVGCGGSASCSCGENCIQTVYCNWGGWNVSNMGTSITPIIGGAAD